MLAKFDLIPVVFTVANLDITPENNPEIWFSYSVSQIADIGTMPTFEIIVNIEEEEFQEIFLIKFINLEFEDPNSPGTQISFR